MNDPTPNIDPKKKGRAQYDEADIGSGERAPGQHETEEMIRSIPGLPANRQSDQGKQDGGKQDQPKQGNESGGGEPPANRQGTPGV